MYGRRSVDFTDIEFDTIVGVLQDTCDATKNEKEKALYQKLIHKITATPCFDNPVVFGYDSLCLVKSNASQYMVDVAMNKMLSDHKLEQQENVQIALANALIMWLNGQNNLKRVVMFDYVDDAYQYESHDD